MGRLLACQAGRLSSHAPSTAALLTSLLTRPPTRCSGRRRRTSCAPWAGATRTPTFTRWACKACCAPGCGPRCARPRWAGLVLWRCGAGAALACCPLCAGAPRSPASSLVPPLLNTHRPVFAYTLAVRNTLSLSLDLTRTQAMAEYEEWSDEAVLADVERCLRELFPEGYCQPRAHHITRWGKVRACAVGRDGAGAVLPCYPLTTHACRRSLARQPPLRCYSCQRCAPAHLTWTSNTPHPFARTPFATAPTPTFPRAPRRSTMNGWGTQARPAWLTHA